MSEYKNICAIFQCQFYNSHCQQSMKLTIQSKKIQINTFDHELVETMRKQAQEKLPQTSVIIIQGNSYSLDFCKDFSQNILSKANNLQSLDVSDIFVARSKEEIPASIQHIAQGLVGKNLLHLDISHNAVNPFGAKALLTYLSQAATLQVFLISNCGLGPMGAAEIAKGLHGTPNLRVLSMGRNRMQSQGIKHIAESISAVPKLEQLFVYQNTLRKEGLAPLFKNLRENCKGLKSLDVCDNFIREEATEQMHNLIIECLQLKNLNLSDCLVEDENDKIIEALKATKNRSFEKLGFNFVEMTSEQALKLLEIAKECPMKRLDITGNDFKKKVKKEYESVYEDKGVLSKFEDDDSDEQQQITRLMQEMKIQ